VKLVSSETRSALSFDDPALVVGQVTRFPIAANEQLLSSKLVNLAPGATAASHSLSFTVPKGKRGFAINVSEVASAGGLVLPGDYVDVIILYDVDFTNRQGQKESEENFLVQTLYQNIEVLAVSQSVVDVVPDAEPGTNGQRVRNSEAKPVPGASTVTLALTPEQVQRLYVAEANGKLRLAVRPYGEAEERPLDFMTELELLPQNLPNPFLR
jgi:pilus assembly protein CpaB